MIKLMVAVTILAFLGVIGWLWKKAQEPII